jgi:hypothetical protein
MLEITKVSKFWASQSEAREIVAEHGCRICTWKFPGEIMDVAGDLWCRHCVEEFMGERPGYPVQVADLDPALIK